MGRLAGTRDRPEKRYKREQARHSTSWFNGPVLLKITVSAGQARPWAARKQLQHKYLEAAAGWDLARSHDLGPHRGPHGEGGGERKGSDGVKVPAGLPVAPSFWRFGGRAEEETEIRHLGAARLP